GQKLMDNNPERQIKRHIYAEPQNLLILCAPGLEDLCKKEIEECLPPESEAKVSIHQTDVSIEGIGYREAQDLVGQLTTSRDILWVLNEKRVGDIEAFDKCFRAVRWQL